MLPELARQPSRPTFRTPTPDSMLESYQQGCLVRFCPHVPNADLIQLVHAEMDNTGAGLSSMRCENCSLQHFTAPVPQVLNIAAVPCGTDKPALQYFMEHSQAFPPGLVTFDADPFVAEATMMRGVNGAAIGFAKPGEDPDQRRFVEIYTRRRLYGELWWIKSMAGFTAKDYPLSPALRLTPEDEELWVFFLCIFGEKYQSQPWVGFPLNVK